MRYRWDAYGCAARAQYRRSGARARSASLRSHSRVVNDAGLDAGQNVVASSATFGPARSAAAGVPALPPAAGATNLLGSFNQHVNPAAVVHPCGRQSCFVRKQGPARKPPPITIRVTARRAVNALFGYFLALPSMSG